MRGETDNYVFGLTVNPFNRSLTCGGSSGGEGAVRFASSYPYQKDIKLQSLLQLIALHGSILGVGSDIGGSVRIPAACQGLYGTKGTMRRVPYLGSTNYMLGMESIESVLGPLSRTLSGCITYYKTIADAQPERYDPTVIPMPWNQAQFEQIKTLKKLTFGYFKSDGLVKPHPPVLRAVDMAIEALKRAGHDIIEWDPIHHSEIYDLANQIYTMVSSKSHPFLIYSDQNISFRTRETSLER